MEDFAGFMKDETLKGDDLGKYFIDLCMLIC